MLSYLVSLLSHLVSLLSCFAFPHAFTRAPFHHFRWLTLPKEPFLRPSFTNTQSHNLHSSALLGKEGMQSGVLFLDGFLAFGNLQHTAEALKVHSRAFFNTKLLAALLQLVDHQCSGTSQTWFFLCRAWFPFVAQAWL